MKMVQLGEVSEIVSGGTPKTSESAYWDGSIPWVTPADLSSHVDAYFDTPARTITDLGLVKSGAVLLPPGSVLMSSRAPIGYAAITRVPMATNQGFKSIVPGPNLDAKYIYHWIKAHNLLLNSLGNGATFKEVSKRTVAGIRIPLPPLDEQRRIAAILDKADAIRQKRRQAIAHLDTLTQSIFHDMFASIQDTETVANLAAKSKRSIRTGPFGSQLLHEEFTSEGVPVLGIDNVVENKFMWKKERYIGESKFQQLEKYEVFPGDVLITIMGTTGRCAVVPIGIPRSINTKHICAITPDTEKVLPEFLQAAFLYHPATQRFSKDNTRGAIMAGLNMGIIKKTPLPLASLSDQKTFVERSQRIDTFRTRLLNGHNSDLFASLQSRAFQGEL